MLLVVAHSRPARRDLRNVCRAHEACVIRRFGHAVLLSATEFAAFQALRLEEKHGIEIQLERVRSFAPPDAPDRVREAAKAYEERDQPSTPYERFASGRELPSPAELREVEL